METIIPLLLINIIVTLVFQSGFVDSIDSAINKRWKFYHLPKPFSCNLCMVMWCSFFYILFTSQLKMFTLALCLINAHLTEIINPLIIVIKSWLLRITEWLMPR